MFELGALSVARGGCPWSETDAPTESSPLVKVVPYLDGTDLRIDSPLLNSTAGTFGGGRNAKGQVY